MDAMKATRSQALTWRFGQHYLWNGADAVEDVVRRVGAVATWPADPELAVGRRMTAPHHGTVDRALADGTLIRTWSFRGAVHLMATDTAGDYLALRCAGRQWERPSWRQYYHLEPAHWPGLRETVRAALAEGPLAPAQLGARVAEDPRFRHLGSCFDAHDVTLLKPFAWQGDLVLGRNPGGQLVLQRPPSSWPGLPPLEEAGHAAVLAYFEAYGPATAEQVHYWLGEGLSAGRRRISRWLAELSGDLVEIDVEGTSFLHLRRHVDALADTATARTLAFLPGHDPWLSGPGTAHPWLIEPGRRPVASRGANLVVVDGRVGGTWKSTEGRILVIWFPEAGEPPRGGLEGEAARLSRFLGEALELSVSRR